MLHRVLVISGVAAVAAMLALAVLVLDGTSDGPRTDEAALQVQTVAPDGSELPDAAARGVVILSNQGQLYGYTPDGEAAGGPFEAPFFDGSSPDGSWHALQHCVDASKCTLVIIPANASLSGDITQTHDVKLDGNFVSGEWSRDGVSFAALDDTGSLYTVDPSTREATVVQACCISAYTWTPAGELLIAGTGKWRESWLALARDGQPITPISTQGAPVTRFYESPDATQIGFAQHTARGLGLSVFDAASGLVTDYGVLHETAGEEGVPFAIAWSHDQRYIAVGPVAAPYTLLVLDAHAGAIVARHTFEEGYAGELAWSPVENRLAISTYSPDRLRHEVYVVDAASDAAPRHLLGGCRIVWSPDGQFLAVKAEPHEVGAAAVNVETGHYWQLAAVSGITPVAWGEDAASARLLIDTPGRSAAVLGK